MELTAETWLLILLIAGSLAVLAGLRLKERKRRHTAGSAEFTVLAGAILFFAVVGAAMASRFGG